MSEEHVNSPVDLKEIILTTGREQIPELNQISSDEVDAVTTNALKMVEEFEKFAQTTPHPKIREDTDVVWDISAAGIFSKELRELPEWQDRYRHLPWSRLFGRTRLRISSAIVRYVAALRVGKLATQLTKEDILEYGPVLLYSGTPDQQENRRTALSTLSDKYRFPPEEKVYIIKGIKNPDGIFRDVYNTVDEVRSLTFPEGMIPRRMVVVSQAEHLVRILHILGQFHDSLPPSTIVQPYPLPTPKEGRSTYTIMEVRGTLAAIYGSHTATPHSYPYQI